MDQMFSLISAANFLDVPQKEIRKLCNNSGISFYTVGDSIRISKTDLTSLVTLDQEGEFHLCQMYSLNSAANLLDISTKTLRRLIRERDLQTYRVGSNIRLNQMDITSLIVMQRRLEDYY